MIAVLFERGHLRADRNELAEDLHLGRAAFDDGSARSWSLKSDKDHQIFRVGQTLRHVMQNSSARNHPARRDDNRGKIALVDLLRFVGGLRECEAGPFDGRSEEHTSELQSLRQL